MGAVLKNSLASKYVLAKHMPDRSFGIIREGHFVGSLVIKCQKGLYCLDGGTYWSTVEGEHDLKIELLPAGTELVVN
jgi:hypothetical protein